MNNKIFNKFNNFIKFIYKYLIIIYLIIFPNNNLFTNLNKSNFQKNIYNFDNKFDNKFDDNSVEWGQFIEIDKNLVKQPYSFLYFYRDYNQLN